MKDKILEKALEILKTDTISIWITGLSGSGKTTLSKFLANNFVQFGVPVKVLDGDDLRKGINSNLGYSMADRQENIRRAAEISKLFNDNGISTINAFICPTNGLRHLAKKIVGEKRYFEIFLNVPVEVCETRDPKGLYKRYREGEFKELTGKDSPYEIPDNPNFVIKTYNESPQDSANRTFESILGYICSLKKDK
jgi:adenylylsulfate kinase